MSTRANAISTAALAAKWRGADRRLSDGGSRGAGRLVAIVRENGATFYFQYFAADGRKRFLQIGPYDSSGRRGVSLQGARDRTAELSSLYRGGVVDLHAHFDRLREAEDRAHHEAKESERRAEQAARSHTLRELLNAYVAHLERSGKQSARAVRGMFKRHVLDAAPDIAERRAADVPAERFVDMIGRLVESGSGRQAAKLRSYLRAAFALAMRARHDPSAPMTLRAFKVEVNPVAAVAAMPQFNKVRDRALAGDELGALLRRLNAAEGAERDATLLALYCGGQRTAQLLRATPGDVDLDAATLALLDSKGRRIQARRHVVPLTKKAGAILRRRLEIHPGDTTPLFGKLRPEMAARLISDLSAEMVSAREAREPFELRDLRRTAETMLAALGVPSDVRAQIQSHGLGGVQARHYDRHSYALEKRSALEKWERHLDGLAAGKSAKVAALPRKAGRQGNA